MHRLHNCGGGKRPTLGDFLHGRRVDMQKKKEKHELKSLLHKSTKSTKANAGRWVKKNAVDVEGNGYKKRHHASETTIAFVSADERNEKKKRQCAKKEPARGLFLTLKP